VSRRLSLRPEALAEIRDAAAWYGDRGFELDVAFFDDLAKTLEQLRASPVLYPKIDADLRKAPLRRFPYMVLQRADEDELVVVACFHSRRNPEAWRSRL
jgi:plasmid stabilization system protein ParE